MTSVSPSKTVVNVFFFRNAADLYGADGLKPSTEDAVGVDLRACLIQEEFLVPGIAGFVYSRSGLGAVKGLTVAQGVGVIDPDYRGEITVFLLNTGAESYTVRQGERIAQLVFHPCVRPGFTAVAALGETNRGAGGFGHTGTVE